MDKLVKSQESEEEESTILEDLTNDNKKGNIILFNLFVFLCSFFFSNF